MAKKNNSLLTPWLWLIISSIIALVFVITLTSLTSTKYFPARSPAKSVTGIGATFEDCVNLQNDYELCVNAYEDDLLGNSTN